MTGSTAALGGEDLRALVREVLLEALPTTPATGQHAPTAPDPRPPARAVVVATDDDLAALVRAVANECADPAARARLAEGTIRYRLANPAPAGSPRPPSDAAATEAADAAGSAEAQEAAEPPVLRVERGAVTERHVRDAARTGSRVVAARGVVVTPLAGDRARSAGVRIEKEH